MCSGDFSITLRKSGFDARPLATGPAQQLLGIDNYVYAEEVVFSKTASPSAGHVAERIADEQDERLDPYGSQLQVWILIPSIYPPFFWVDISELQVHPWTAFDFTRSAEDDPSSDSP